MELIKPIYVGISLLLLHITRPFDALLIHKTYSMLLTSFNFYEHLTQISPNRHLMKNKVVNFLSDDMFEKTKHDLCLLDFLAECIKSFPAEIEKLIATALPKFTIGFDK